MDLSTPPKAAATADASQRRTAALRLGTPALWLSLVAAAAAPLACSETPSAPSGAAPSAAPSAAAAEKPREPLKAPVRVGGALMRSADGARLVLADEDHKALRVLPLPVGAEPLNRAAIEKATAALLAAYSASAGAGAAPVPSNSAAAGRPSASAKASAAAAVVKEPPPGTIPPIPAPPSAAHEEMAMPGAPAQVLPLDGRVLATIRDPGLLLVLKEETGNKLKETARIPVAADAWGLAVTPDEKTAIVTSAWTHTVTGVDLGSNKVLWTLDVAREPRGVVIHPNGKTAYISHLTSASLTRIDDIAGAAARASAVAFPAAPSRTPQGLSLPASLGYALVMDEAGNRLLAARHALGALGESTWFGIATVDVLQTQNDKPLLAPRQPEKRIKTTPAYEETRKWAMDTFSSRDPHDYRLQQVTAPALRNNEDLVQPRAMVVAQKSQSVWIASEGKDTVVEVPLMAAAPIEQVKRAIDVGSKYKDPKIISSYGDYGGTGIPGHCGAPTGLALSADETFLYVFCRSTYDIATVRISDGQGVTVARVAQEPLDETVSRGRRLFYGARDRESSGGMGCAGCHPEGRDDGHVWHEVFELPDSTRPIDRNFLASKNLAVKTFDGKLGHPRQTPMLAGRVNASGPYGWTAQNETLADRVAEGFGLHRWNGAKVDGKKWIIAERSKALQAFLRKGLATPPRIDRELTEEEQQGKKIFESDAAQCVRCHVPASEFTDRTAYPLKKMDPPPGFQDEGEEVRFKTPSLLFIGGTPPYYHDGHAPTLEALISQNGDRMGRTSHLSPAEKAALVSYLKTL